MKPIHWEGETEEPQIQTLSSLQSEFTGSLRGLVRPWLFKGKGKKKRGPGYSSAVKYVPNVCQDLDLTVSIVCVCVCVPMPVCVSVCICVCMSVCICICVHVCLHRNVYLCVYIYVHTCVSVPVCVSSINTQQCGLVIV